MEIKWHGEKCILCLINNPNSEEHLIPRSFNGVLTCRFLCSKCNSKLGSKYEGSAKFDPKIQNFLLNQNFTSKHLVKLLDNYTFHTIGQGGSSIGEIRNQNLIIKTQYLHGNTIICSNTDAIKQIRSRLNKQNYPESAIRSAIKQYEHSPENLLVELPGNLEIIKWTIRAIQPITNGPELNVKIPLKTAYEYLALLVNEEIYAKLPCLNSVRFSLLNPDAEIDSNHVLIERFNIKSGTLFHGLFLMNESPYIIIQVRYFGVFAFLVHFKTLTTESLRYSYTHDLEKGYEWVEKF